ncbi:RNA polymerase sigma factor [uncultured Maribacter sp.]|uniref:RNA polymerase sigma factor n=1 Tax=uncultured Maribacter sp. TaxID=431308 RepID=UPI002602BC21|nr:RNA polymerase sigma factor [uncultured Maribacter sp.]
MKDTLEILVEKANLGDRKALESVVLNIKDYIYNLSLKMLLYSEDAEDATQEILIKVITHLSTFNHKSKFMTWVYRVATNYLQTYKGKKSKEFAMSFGDYADLIDTGRSDTVRYSTNEGELSLLEEEVKVSCTQGLLLCLNSVDRMVYILTEILEFNSVEGSEIMEITAENYRKKVSRSRAKIRNFLNNKCGLSNPKNPCRCNKKIDFLVDQKIVNPKELRFSGFSKRSIDLVEKLGELEKSIAIYRSVPKAHAPMTIFNNIKQALALD